MSGKGLGRLQNFEVCVDRQWLDKERKGIPGRENSGNKVGSLAWSTGVCEWKRVGVVG